MRGLCLLGPLEDEKEAIKAGDEIVGEKEIMEVLE